METVKVDTQKLQLLNERIAQLIDALNQVRMSAHGVQHTPAVTPWGYGQTYGAYASPGFSVPSPFIGSPLTQHPAQQYAMTPYAPFGAPVFGGLSHTTLPAPWTTTPWTTTPWAATPQWQTPYTGNGISHTTWDPTVRTQQFPWMQTFPVTIS